MKRKIAALGDRLIYALEVVLWVHKRSRHVVRFMITWALILSIMLYPVLVLAFLGDQLFSLLTFWMTMLLGFICAERIYLGISGLEPNRDPFPSPAPGRDEDPPPAT